jgi:DNA anti-recombination protein RmuC
MTTKPSEGWGPEGTAKGATAATGSHSLKGMIADAMSKSRGQGVVQGSTIFFKNLAESVSHSNRNLKIGLAFLTGAFVVVAASLGYLVTNVLRGQAETKSTMEEQYRQLDTKTQKILEPFLQRNKELDERLARLETQIRSEMETVRLNSEQRVDQARAEIQRLQPEIQALRQDVNKFNDWVKDANKQLKTAFEGVDTRLKALESGAHR